MWCEIVRLWDSGIFVELWVRGICGVLELWYCGIVVLWDTGIVG